MFQHKIEPFGTFEKHTLFNTATGDSLEIVPNYGSCLLSLTFSGKQILDGYDTPEALIANKWSKNVMLLPFPNRLRDGKYSHLGKEYSFPINNASTGNAIHGFGKDAPMRVESVGLTQLSAAITSIWRYDGSNPSYPFPFSFKTWFSIAHNSLQVRLTLYNDGEQPIPAGLGWHPYFRIAERSDEVSLMMPEVKKIEIDERMLPTGEETPFDDFKTLTKIGETSLDNGFYIVNQDQNAETVISSELGKLTFWQETGFQQWNFLQVFTPPHRESIAIEPMTCNIDAFNNKDGLALLEPRTGMIGSFGVKFKPN